MMRDTFLLIRKHLKEDLRRPKGFTCEMICPVIVFLLFALLRATIDKEEIDINYSDDIKEAKLPVFYDYKDRNSTYATLNIYTDIARLICLEGDLRSSDSGLYYPASYFAIIPPPSTHSNIQHIINEMTLAWNYSKISWDTSNTNCQFQQFSIPQCRTECKYNDLTFTENSILKYFNSESELNSYLTNNKYGSNTWDPTDFASSDKIRPISFAIVFNNYENWESMSYTLRGNATYIPTTQGEKVDLFTKDWSTLFFGSYQVNNKVYISS